MVEPKLTGKISEVFIEVECQACKSNTIAVQLHIFAENPSHRIMCSTCQAVTDVWFTIKQQMVAGPKKAVPVMRGTPNEKYAWELREAKRTNAPVAIKELQYEPCGANYWEIVGWVHPNGRVTYGSKP